jgi:hypothetical protein
MDTSIDELLFSVSRVASCRFDAWWKDSIAKFIENGKENGNGPANKQASKQASKRIVPIVCCQLGGKPDFL